MSSISISGDPAPISTHDAALTYFARGWCVLPANGKVACASWKRFQLQRPSEAQLSKWFGSGKLQNLAVLLGEVSGGLVCRDFDQTASYIAWSQEYPDLADTLPTVWTPRGRHVYCLTTTEQIMKPGKAYIDLGDGELRLTGCYCIAPPSTHPDGLPYRWLNPPTADVPLVKNLEAIGFYSDWSGAQPRKWVESLSKTRKPGRLTEQTEHTEHTEQTEHTDAFGADECKPMHTEAIKTAAIFAKNAKTATTWKKLVCQAVQDTLPKGPGQRNKCLFQLVRRLKAIPEVAKREGLSMQRELEHWHKLALPQIRTKDYYVSLSEFLTAWDKAQFPEGCDPIVVVTAEADQEPVPKCAEQFQDSRMQRLVAVCRTLQRYAGDGEFYLSCRKAGQVIELSHETAAIWLRLLEQAKILRTETKGNSSTRRASRFRYLGD